MDHENGRVVLMLGFGFRIRSHDVTTPSILHKVGILFIFFLIQRPTAGAAHQE